MLPPDQPVRIAERLVHRVIGDEVFVLMFDSRIHWLKNPTAKTLWQALVTAGPTGASPRTLAAALVSEFEVDLPTALADTVSFLTILQEKGLVDSKSAGP